MKSEDLQKLIKVYVRQALNEALAEKYLQNIVKEAVAESLKVASLIKENTADDSRHVRKVKQQKTQQPESVVRNLGVRNPIMTEIFNDTLNSNNPILTGEENAGSEVSEAQLEKVGVYDRDWSKFIK